MWDGIVLLSCIIHLVNGRDTDFPPLAQPLTPREEEILTCLGDEMSNRQIAEHLTLSLNTVKWYVRQVYNKLGVDNRGEAVTRARSLGLLPPEEQGGPIRNNLPLAATPFVGRERELSLLADLFADPHARLITISGPGGIGKTRLALEAARRELESVPASAGMTSSFADGVFFVSLAPLEAAGEIVSTLASALDFHFQDSGNEQEQLLNYLRNKQMLLVMDNFEHILDGRSLLVQINEQAAEITLLVTSRERLQLRGKQLFPLGGLETTQDDEALGETPASELFLHIARRAVPDFQLLAGDDEHLLRICRLVEGMPLGLELAASWAGLLPLCEIAAEIEQSLDLLASEHHDVPPRHKSMEAALDVSWRRLTDEQQRAFQELTVFRGGFTRTAAREVAGAMLPLLVTLANKSWLTYDRQNDRYYIHELLRQYGAARLSDDLTLAQETRQKHSAYFCTYLQDREADWFGARQREAAAEIGDEIDNVQTAWRWAANKGNSVLLAQGLNSLCRFYLWEGRKADGWHACRFATDGLSRSPAEHHTNDAQRLALWSLVLAWESDFVNEIAQKQELLARSQGILDRAIPGGQDTRAEQAFIFLRKAYVAEYTDIDEAIHYASEGLKSFRELGDRWNEAEALQVLGNLKVALGEFKLANDLLRSSLEIRRHLDDTMGIAETMVYIGYIAKVQGRFEEAEMFLRQSLGLFRQLDHQPGKMYCLGELSNALSWAGKFVAARETVARALRMDQDLGLFPNGERVAFLTTVNIHLGDYAEAKVSATEVLEVCRREGTLGGVGLALMYLGSIAFVEGNFAEAKRCLLESALIHTNLNHILQALPETILCYVVRAQGEKEMARDYLLSALRSGVRSHYIPPIIYCLPAAALLAIDAGQTERAVELHGLAQQFGYIRNSRWFEDVACRELDEVRASLPADVAAEAAARGREMDVWETAEALLRELDGRRPVGG